MNTILESNKKIAVDFFNAVVNQKDYELAKQFVGPYFKEHSFHSSDGIEGLKNGIIYFLAKYPHSKTVIKRIIAENDYVMLHTHIILDENTSGSAVMELFRLENEKVIEHWDITEDIPDKLEHTNGVF